MKINSSIRDRRLTLGITLTHIAKEVGISASYAYEVERGTRHMTGKLVTSWARALDLSPIALAELIGSCSHCLGTGDAPGVKS
jgi:transcriptional regulator with XRE-family HTH domain